MKAVTVGYHNFVCVSYVDVITIIFCHLKISVGVYLIRMETNCIIDSACTYSAADIHFNHSDRFFENDVMNWIMYFDLSLAYK